MDNPNKSLPVLPTVSLAPHQIFFQNHQKTTKLFKIWKPLNFPLKYFRRLWNEKVSSSIKMCLHEKLHKQF